MEDGASQVGDTASDNAAEGVQVRVRQNTEPNVEQRRLLSAMGVKWRRKQRIGRWPEEEKVTEVVASKSVEKIRYLKYKGHFFLNFEKWQRWVNTKLQTFKSVNSVNIVPTTSIGGIETVSLNDLTIVNFDADAAINRSGIKCLIPVTASKE